MQGVHLIFHEGNERRNHNRKALAYQSRQLKTKRFAAARWHQHKHITPGQGIADDLTLQQSELIMAEMFFERRDQIHSVCFSRVAALCQNCLLVCRVETMQNVDPLNKMNINLGRVGTTLMILGVISGSTSWAAVSGASRRTVAIDPKVAGLVKQAGSELKLDQYDAAIRHLSAALQMKPETTTAAAIHSWRADAYIQKGDLSNAMSDASESIRLNPRYYGGYLERGIVYRRTGDPAKAVADYDAVIGLNPNFARAYYDRAIAYGLKGNHKQAIRDNTAVIRLNPNDPDFYIIAASIIKLSAASIKRWQTTTKRSAGRQRSLTIIADGRMFSKKWVSSQRQALILIKSLD